MMIMIPLTTPILIFLGYKRSYHSAYDSDSDSVASENQPLVAFNTRGKEC